GGRRPHRRGRFRPGRAASLLGEPLVERRGTRAASPRRTPRGQARRRAWLRRRAPELGRPRPRSKGNGHRSLRSRPRFRPLQRPREPRPRTLYAAPRLARVPCAGTGLLRPRPRRGRALRGQERPGARGPDTRPPRPRWRGSARRPSPQGCPGIPGEDVGDGLSPVDGGKPRAIGRPDGYGPDTPTPGLL
ncbi:MAG: hypothetical protein AVDCRST_MAG78-3214, partial [uncultured Rubrobacteraceae bacterium]